MSTARVMVFNKVVPMRAMGKARPRVTMRGTFMPREYTAWKRELALRCGSPTLPHSCVLSIVAKFRVPKSVSKLRRATMIGVFRDGSPDADNIAGAVMDALWSGDSGVQLGKVIRVWAERDEIEITVEA